MSIWSHSRKKKDSDEREGSKLLIDHLSGVRAKAFQNKFAHLYFVENEVDEILEAVCCLHDLGKCTSYFQDYLLNGAKINSNLHYHSQMGAFAAYSKFEAKSQLNALLAWYLIKMHHSNLTNLDWAIKRGGNLNKYAEEDAIKKQKDSISDLSLYDEVFPIDQKWLVYRPQKELYGVFKKWLKKADDIQLYFLVNYLFSLLIEADKLDASDTGVYQPVDINPNAVDDNRFGPPALPEKQVGEMNQNELRNYVRGSVVSQLDAPDFLEIDIFTLAAPTGIGKTMTALDFFAETARQNPKRKRRLAANYLCLALYKYY